MRYLGFLICLFLSYAALAVDTTDFGSWLKDDSSKLFSPAEQSKCPLEDGFEQNIALAGAEATKFLTAVKLNGANCAKRVIDKFATDVKYDKEATKYLTPWSQTVIKRCEGDESPVCQKARQVREQTAKNIADLFRFINGSNQPQTREKINLLGCQQPETADDISKLVSEINEALNCRDLSVGDTLNVTGSRGHNYALTRLSPKNYRADLAIKFQLLDEATSADAQALYQKINTCLSTTSAPLRLPDGRQLSMVVHTPEQVSAIPIEKRPQITEVALLKNTMRQHSTLFSLNMGCSAIVHELLHHLGLPDEYHDEDAPCRVVPTTMTPMSNPHAMAQPELKITECEAHPKLASKLSDQKLLQQIASTRNYLDTIGEANRFCELTNSEEKTNAEFLSALKTTSITVSGEITTIQAYEYQPAEDKPHLKTVTCNCANAVGIEKYNCLRHVEAFKVKIAKANEVPPNLCPPGFIMAKSPTSNTMTPGTSITGTKIRYVTRQPTGARLTPSEFDLILAGNCKTKAVNYRACAEWAELNSCQAPGDCIGGPDKCPGPPRQCFDDSFYLGVPEKSP